MTIRVLGVDVASSEWSSNGSALVEFDSNGWRNVVAPAVVWPTTHALTPRALARALMDYCAQESISAISLDGPQGWRDPGTSAELPGVGRRCEYACNTQGKTAVYPLTYPSSQFGWINFCVELFDELLRFPDVRLISTLEEAGGAGIGILECFPSSAWLTSGLEKLPGKAKRPTLAPFVERLRKAYGLPPFVIHSHDDLQGVVAALVAAAVFGGPCDALPEGVPAKVVEIASDLRRCEGVIWNVCPKGERAKSLLNRGLGASASPAKQSRPQKTQTASDNTARIYVTSGVLAQVNRSNDPMQAQIAASGIPGGTKNNRVTAKLVVDGVEYVLIVGDSHAIWRSHQTANTRAHWEALFGRLADVPGTKIVVESVQVVS